MFSAIYASPNTFYNCVTNVTLVARKKSSESSDFVERHDVKALDGNGVLRTLYIHPHYDASDRNGGIFTMGVNHSRGKYKSNRLSLALILDNKKEEEEFADLLETLTDILSKHVGKPIKSPVSVYTKDGLTKKSIWCNVIGSSTGNLYTVAYDANKNNINVNNLNQFMHVRPAISLSVIVKADGSMTMKCNLTEFCVIDVVDGRSRGFLAPE